MSKIIFNELQLKQLENNPNILQLTERSITYHPDFKIKAVQENLNGKGPYQIFSEHDFDMTTIGSGKPKKCLVLWRKTYRLFGEGWLAYGS
ncbi:hypothetical protein ACFFIX_18490 [Metabacillus herbersteinensis]|uniref:Transposase n=1 Tax=Metabacillus herbersteinensis TaxID=283816 RepID=A0ABV6GI78_9BACI